jgi:hypothetical protein
LGNIALAFGALGGAGLLLMNRDKISNAFKRSDSSGLNEDPEILQEILGSSTRRQSGGSSGSTGGDVPEANRGQQYKAIESTIAMKEGDPAASIRGEAQARWDSCGGGSSNQRQAENFQPGTITGYYLGSPNRCNELTISKNLLDFLNNHLAQCVQDNLKDQDIEGNVESIVLGHRGITGDSNHASRSLHSINRAIDIATIHIKLDNGEVIERSANGQQRTTPHSVFYANLRSCWNEKIIENHTANCPGSVPKGSIGCEDPNHQGHIHLSLPFCPSSSTFNIK